MSAGREATRGLSERALRALVERSAAPSEAAEDAPTRVFTAEPRSATATVAALPTAGPGRSRGRRRADGSAPADRLARWARPLAASVALLGAGLALWMAWGWLLIGDAQPSGARASAGVAGPPAAPAGPSPDAVSPGSDGTGRPSAPPVAPSPHPPAGASASHPDPTPPSPTSAVEALTRGDLSLALDLYRGLAATTGEPVFAGIAGELQRTLECESPQSGETPCDG